MQQQQIPVGPEGVALQGEAPQGRTPAGMEQFDFQENPFMKLLGQQGGAPAGAEAGLPGLGAPGPQAPGPQGAIPQQGGAPAGATPGLPAGLPGEEVEPEINQLNPGENPSKSADLVKAISALESFASNSTDKQEISLVRGVLSALARLMSKDQEGLRGLL